MSNIYVTANTFFGREKYYNKIKRFKGLSIEEVNAALLEGWAEIPNTDIIYHLGNYAWDPITSEDTLKLLSSKMINFMFGEYDQALIESLEAFKNIQTNYLLFNKDIIPINSKNVVLSFWPLLDWPGKDKGVINVYGKETKIPQDLNGNRICASQNLWGYKPVNIDMILEFFNDKK